MALRNAPLDRTVESLGRWTAARTTRRSFLGRLGRVGLVLAAGPQAALAVAGEAAAATRVCGQTGTSPRCPTFDCPATWGWCWYATGCCADGGLKKICDCCAPNTPNPVGYCPPGTRVLCIVESCGTDPRLQTRELVHIPAEHAAIVSAEVSRRRFPATAPIAVVGDAESPGHAAVASSLGGVVGGPVLLTARAGLYDVAGDELARLRVGHAVVAGSRLSGGVDAALAARGVQVWRVGEAVDLEGFAAEVAAWSRSMTGRRSAMVVIPGPAEQAVSAAGAFAQRHRLPLLVGVGAPTQAALAQPRPVHTTYVVTTAPQEADRFPGGTAVLSGNGPGLAARIAELDGRLGGDPSTVTLAPVELPRAATGAGTWPAPLLLFAGNTMDGAREPLMALRERLRQVVVASPDATFGSAARYELQSIVNGFETHQLRGGPGEGLPVIEQPPAERPIGRARR